MIFAVQPNAANVKVASLIADEFLEIKIEQHQESALVCRTGFDAPGNVVWVGGYVEEFKIDASLRKLGAQPSPGAKEVILLGELFQGRFRGRRADSVLF